jgi:hypothetical protein
MSALEQQILLLEGVRVGRLGAAAVAGDGPEEQVQVAGGPEAFAADAADGLENLRREHIVDRAPRSAVIFIPSSIRAAPDAVDPVRALASAGGQTASDARVAHRSREDGTFR